MIQRIQTIYLLIAVVLSVVCLCMQVGALTDGDGTVTGMYNLFLAYPNGAKNFVTWPLFVVLLLSAAIALYAIFMYANRMLQLRFCLFSMLLIVGWYILYAVYAHLLLPDSSAAAFSPSVAAVFPLVSILMLFLARRAIFADEELVRAADRIR